MSFSEQLDPDGATICRRSFFDVQKYDKNDRYGQERTEMNWNGQKWTEMDRNGQKRQKWTEIDKKNRNGH